MSAIIPSTKKEGTCAICYNEFTDSDTPLTHEGGEGHDGFHPSCLKNWVTLNPTCPFDRQDIDRSSLVSKIDLIRARLETAMAHAALAACFGTVTAVVGRVAAAGVNRVAASEQIAKMPPIIIGIVQVVSALAAGTVALGAALGSGVAARAIGAGTIGRGVAFTAGAIAVDRIITKGTQKEAATGAALVAFMGLAGARVEGGSVGWGMLVGGCVPLIVGAFFNGKHALHLSTGLPWIAGASAGILSLIRGK